MRTCLAALAMMALVALPGAFASLCGRTGALEGDCEAVMASDLSQGEKLEAVGALLAGDSFLPPHDEALAWNRQLLKDDSGREAPSATPTKSQGAIQDAWVKLLGLHPSTRQQGALLYPGEGVALLASGYSIVPYEGKLGWDCRTDYRPEKPYVELRLLANGVSQGMGSEVKYKVGGDATLTARLDVSQTTYVDHYTSYTYCCRVGCGCGLLGCYCVCSSYCTDCKFSSTETWQNSVAVEDLLEAKLYSYTPEASLAPVEEHRGTVKAIFSPDGTENTRLTVGVQGFFSQGTVYTLDVGEQPFETLTVIATPSGPVGNSTLLLPAGSECAIEVQGHFGASLLPCSTEYTGPMLEISTDRIFYKAGEPIRVRIGGVEEAEIDYAGESLNASGTASLTARAGFTSITAHAVGQEASATIGVVNTPLWMLLLRIIVLLLIVAGIYSLIRNWARRGLLWDAA